MATKPQTIDQRNRASALSHLVKQPFAKMQPNMKQKIVQTLQHHEMEVFKKVKQQNRVDWNAYVEKIVAYSIAQNSVLMQKLIQRDPTNPKHKQNIQSLQNPAYKQKEMQKLLQEFAVNAGQPVPAAPTSQRPTPSPSATPQNQQRQKLNTSKVQGYLDKGVSAVAQYLERLAHDDPERVQTSRLLEDIRMIKARIVANPRVIEEFARSKDTTSPLKVLHSRIEEIKKKLPLSQNLKIKTGFDHFLNYLDEAQDDEKKCPMAGRIVGDLMNYIDYAIPYESKNASNRSLAQRDVLLYEVYESGNAALDKDLATLRRYGVMFEPKPCLDKNAVEFTFRGHFDDPHALAPPVLQVHINLRKYGTLKSEEKKEAKEIDPNDVAKSVLEPRGFLKVACKLEGNNGVFKEQHVAWFQTRFVKACQNYLGQTVHVDDIIDLVNFYHDSIQLLVDKYHATFLQQQQQQQQAQNKKRSATQAQLGSEQTAKKAKQGD